MEHFPLVDRLHTDVLEERYGKITAKVVKHTNSVREAHLVDKRGVSMTYAITFFSKKRSKKILATDKEIRSGIPIGKAFRNKGCAIRKNVIDVFVIKIPAYLKKEFRTKENFAKARLSEFYARKGRENPIIYGTVVEIYSPNFRKAHINSTDLSQINPTTEKFHAIKISMDEIWKRISKGNNWNDVKDKYEKAKTDSVVDVEKLRRKINLYLAR